MILVKSNLFFFRGLGGVAGTSSNRVLLMRFVGVMGITDMACVWYFDDVSLAQSSSRPLSIS